LFYELGQIAFVLAAYEVRNCLPLSKCFRERKTSHYVAGPDLGRRVNPEHDAPAHAADPGTGF
jgi:hypothetical protein